MAYGLPGRVDDLTQIQEDRLRKLWRVIFHVCGLVPEYTMSHSDHFASNEKEGADDSVNLIKKKRFGVFWKKDTDKIAPAAESSAVDKYEETKKFHEALSTQGPNIIREAIWTMVKHDHPDALVLRFLRARNWDIDRALMMLISTMLWRQNEMKVDLDLMPNGEHGAIADEQGVNGDSKRVIGRDFMTQIREGKTFLHGVDRQGRPICLVRVRLHKQGEQCEASLQKHVVYIIETARMMLRPPVDTATIIFDMTGFSVANMDYNAIKFVIQCFEANFPESLGAVLVHRSPWIFQGIWKVIRGWLDPIVASKVHFTNNRSELEQFIEPSRILHELGGDEMWHYKYVEPLQGENDLMKDYKTRDRLLQNRDTLVKEFETATMEWLHAPDTNSKQNIEARRAAVAQKLSDNYWELDPYIRARSLYDRLGVLRGGSMVDWYPTRVECEGEGPNHRDL